MPRKAVYKHKLYLSLDNILVINFGFGSCGFMSQAKIIPFITAISRL